MTKRLTLISLCVILLTSCSSAITDPYDDVPTFTDINQIIVYMHDGRFKTLRQVIDHYSSGVHPHVNVAIAFAEGEDDGAETSGFRLTDRQKSALVAFLNTLTDDRFLTDPRFSDPFTHRSTKID